MWYPLKFRPIYREQRWCGRYLEKTGRQLPDGCTAESLEISGSLAEASIVENGSFAGTALPELLAAHPEELLGKEPMEKNNEEEAVFPLQIRFIDAADPLPVQVHAPKYAAALHAAAAYPGQAACEINKIWYVVSARPGARMALGLIRDMSREQFIRKIEGSAVLECLNYADIAPGDVIGVPPGLVHAGGRGTLLVEIQSHANRLYTIYNYNRVDKEGRRLPLQVIRALDAVDCRQRGSKCSGLEIIINDTARKTVFAATRLLAAELYIVEDELEEETDGSKFYAFVFTEGETILEYGSDFLIARQGETVLLPAALGKYRLKGKFKAIRTYVPDIEKEIILPLKKAGYSHEEIKENIGGIGGV